MSPRPAADVRHSPPPIAGEGIQVFDDADGVILGGQRHAMPRVEGQKQPHEEPEGNLARFPAARSIRCGVICMPEAMHEKCRPSRQSTGRFFFRNPSIPSRYCRPKGTGRRCARPGA